MAFTLKDIHVSFSKINQQEPDAVDTSKNWIVNFAYVNDADPDDVHEGSVEYNPDGDDTLNTILEAIDLLGAP